MVDALKNSTIPMKFLNRLLNCNNFTSQMRFLCTHTSWGGQHVCRQVIYLWYFYREFCCGHL